MKFVKVKVAKPYNKAWSEVNKLLNKIVNSRNKLINSMQLFVY